MTRSLVGDDYHDGSYRRLACSECQRRKQKCNREWPCNHCHKRKVADECQFNNESQPISAWAPSVDIRQKRDQSCLMTEENCEWYSAEGLEGVGYTASHVLAMLRTEIEVRRHIPPKQHHADPRTDALLQRALQVLPSRPHMDSIIQNFLSNVNFYYYIVYPPNFLTEYHEWWVSRSENQALGLPWTCLLLMICACSVQHMDAEMATALEADLGQPHKQLTDHYHDAARELHSAIPVGYSHMFTLQYLLHSCYWYMEKARFVECWLVLGTAIREGQTLGLHQEANEITDFEREMRRRMWCLLNAWDWLVSSILARPMLIDRTDSDVNLPSLNLEGYPTSPLLHVKLQSQLVNDIFKRFGPPKCVTEPNDIFKYQDVVEAWMQTLPPPYAFIHADCRLEAEYPWIALHRHYVHTVAFSMILSPLRPYMAKLVTKQTPEVELTLRGSGVKYALKLMGTVHAFFDYVWSRDTSFHSVPFYIFDTATLLVSALSHDEAGTIPRKDEIMKDIDLALCMLKQLTAATETAKTPYSILRRLSVKLQRPGVQGVGDDSSKRSQVTQVWLRQPRRDQVASHGFTYSTDPNVPLANMTSTLEDPGVGNWSAGSCPAVASSPDGLGLITTFTNPQIVDPPPGACALPTVALAQPAMQDTASGMFSDMGLSNSWNCGATWNWEEGIF